MSKDNKSKDAQSLNNFGKSLEEFVVAVAKLLVMYFKVFGYGLNRGPKFTKKTWIHLGLIFVGTLAWSVDGAYVDLIKWVLKKYFSGESIEHFQDWSTWSHFFFLFLLMIGTYIPCLGLRRFGLFQKAEQAIKKMGLKNSEGYRPKVVSLEELSEHRHKYRICCNGVGIDDFKNKKSTMEACFSGNIEQIEQEENPNYLQLVVSKKRLSEKVLYSNLISKLEKPYSFIVGESYGDVITQDISELPHLLIAGATGGGKSVFFKQTILGMLENSPHIQCYLIDLKRGLEFMDFEELPNVKVIKDEMTALSTLKEIRNEMDRRFDYLAIEKKNKIDHEKDKKDKILVCVDEASVLFTKSKYNKSSKALSERASEVADLISKQARAVGIHLIFALQKVDNRSLDTSIRENVTGRMCFRQNSVESSNMMLGTKNACTLPKIPGRAIWKSTNEEQEVQAPLITTEEIKIRCKVICEEYKNKKRKNLQLMLDGFEEEEIEEKEKKKPEKVVESVKLDDGDTLA